MSHDQIIVLMLTNDANRKQCIAVMESTDGDLRAHAQARLNVLDRIQRDAQRECYTKTPPGMVEAWELKDWFIEEHGTTQIHHIDFHSISDGKKQEWYAYQNSILNDIL